MFTLKWCTCDSSATCMLSGLYCRRRDGQPNFFMRTLCTNLRGNPKLWLKVSNFSSLLMLPHTHLSRSFMHFALVFSLILMVSCLAHREKCRKNSYHPHRSINRFRHIVTINSERTNFFSQFKIIVNASPNT